MAISIPQKQMCYRETNFDRNLKLIKPSSDSWFMKHPLFRLPVEGTFNTYGSEGPVPFLPIPADVDRLLLEMLARRIAGDGATDRLIACWMKCPEYVQYVLLEWRANTAV